MRTPLPSTSPTEAPSWPYCAHGADPVTDPVGCRGIHVTGSTACLAHLNDVDRTTYLAGLAPGAGIDHRGTPFTGDLLDQLLTAVTDPATRDPHISTARFDGAKFSGIAAFHIAQFSGDARFNGAKFSGDAWFDGAQFTGTAAFNSVEFSGTAGFSDAQFSGDAGFDSAQFFGDVWFIGAEFSGGITWFNSAKFFGTTWFNNAQFSGDAAFNSAKFSGDVWFNSAQFLMSARWGPLVCAGRVDLSGAVFGAPVTLEIAASAVQCTRTRWESTATVRVRRAKVDLGYAVLAAPVAVTAHPTPFAHVEGASWTRAR
ncbi:pentapeptide repeat-containing protein [Streptomyces virginiae]|uniref:pentapeptide repeat-containing protein n=1 Tax=Streptomyces virginiae TaxID=1961 RepID=UPI00368E2AFB